MKDNEKVILIVLGIIAAILLPYFLYSKEAKMETKSVEAQCEERRVELSELEEMYKHKEEYEQKEVEYNEEFDNIIAKFPADVLPEKTTLFLLDTEYSLVPDAKYEKMVKDYMYGNLPPFTGLVSDMKELNDRLYLADKDLNPIKIQLANGDAYFEYKYNVPIVFSEIGFGNKIETPIAAEGTDTGYWAVTNDTNITFQTYYPGFLHLLEALKTVEGGDPMTYVSVSASFDEDAGSISGIIVLEQYAVIGDEREMGDLEWIVDQKWDVEVKPDDRGNEYYGIFGPRDLTNKEIPGLSEKKDEPEEVEEVEIDE